MMDGNIYKKGFTLIELLVVVLIIGILAAIALPQYQTAVDKARFVQAVADLDALKKAEEVYYLANGEYTKKLEDLDIDLKYASFDQDRYQSPDGKCYAVVKEVNSVHGSNTSTRAAHLSTYCVLKKPYAGNGYGERIGILMYMDRATYGSNTNPQPIPVEQRRICLPFEGKNQTDRAERICKSYGGTRITTVTNTVGYPM